MKNKGAFAAFALGTLAGTIVGKHFYGPEGKKHRKEAVRFMKKAKAEILEKLEDIQDVSEEKFHEVVDGVMEGYASAEEIGKEKAARASAFFKSQWKKMKAAVEEARLEAEEDEIESGR